MDMPPFHNGALAAYRRLGSGVGGGSSGGLEMVMEFMDGGSGSFRSNVTMAATTGVQARASKSHSEAERRRRQRINNHLATLRALLPNTSKMDKASLLTEVVRQVRELRRCAEDVASSEGDAWKEAVPGEIDEVKLDPLPPPSSAQEEGGDRLAPLLRASVCCEDRPGLMADLNHAIRSVHARAVRVEMSTIGGRTKSVVLVERAEVGEEGDRSSSLQSALRAVIHRTGPAGLDRLTESKRLRFARPIGRT